MTTILSRCIVYLVVIFSVFFTKKKLPPLSKKWVGLLFFLMLASNTALIVSLSYLLKKKSLYWMPFVLQEVVLNFLVWIQLGFDYTSWPTFKDMYLREKMVKEEMDYLIKQSPDNNAFGFDEDEFLLKAI
mmetsp:Transcript_31453/g.48114  ORF Transcript_31453/g.48114 Transcript_31453/m.48114 type:complete len:130 (-) Transcript_31453:834-1223(-)